MNVGDGDTKGLTAEHNGDVSYWWRARGGFPPRRPSLPGPASADVCIVGAGFTGLWTAYYLKQAEPSLRIVVLEAAFTGFGASGRNGGWLTSALPGSRERYARGPGGRDAVLDLQRQLRETVDEGRAGLRRGGHRRRSGQGRRTGGSDHPRPAGAAACRAGGRPGLGPGRGRRPLPRAGRASRTCPHRRRPRRALLPALCAYPARQAGHGSRPGGRARRRRDLRGDPGDPDRPAPRRGKGIGRAGPCTSGHGPGVHDIRRRDGAVCAAGYGGLHRPPARPAPHTAADEQLHDRDRATGRRCVAGDRLGRIRDHR